jgi:hypothetical protein
MAKGIQELPKVSPGLLCLTLLRPAGEPPPKQPYGHFLGGLPAGWAACDRFGPFWIPLAVRICFYEYDIESRPNKVGKTRESG